MRLFRSPLRNHARLDGESFCDTQILGICFGCEVASRMRTLRPYKGWGKDVSRIEIYRRSSRSGAMADGNSHE